MVEITREQAIALVRAHCLTQCRAMLCELNNRCMALLYDTPGFVERVEATMIAGTVPHVPQMQLRNGED